MSKVSSSGANRRVRQKLRLDRSGMGRRSYRTLASKKDAGDRADERDADDGDRNEFVGHCGFHIPVRSDEHGAEEARHTGREDVIHVDLNILAKVALGEEDGEEEELCAQGGKTCQCAQASIAKPARTCKRLRGVRLADARMLYIVKSAETTFFTRSTET